MDEELIFINAMESGERIDALLAHNIDDLSRSAAQKLIETGCVMLLLKESGTLSSSEFRTEEENAELNSRKAIPVRKNYKCTSGDVFRVIMPDIAEIPLIPQDIPLDIIYEDKSVIVINKQRGLVVHPAPGHPDGTLVNALMFHCGDSLSGIGGEKRPGIVHRIDKDTSGLLIVAKNDYAHQFLSAQLADRSLSRIYDAVVHGRFKDFEGIVDKPIGRDPNNRKKMAVTERNARNAITHWKVIDYYKDYSHIRCKLETGRTHQIRVHMASIGHPLLGDGIYGAKSPDKGLEGQCLHASHLQFIHPDTKKLVQLSVPLPDYFEEILSKLGRTID